MRERPVAAVVRVKRTAVLRECVVSIRRTDVMNVRRVVWRRIAEHVNLVLKRQTSVKVIVRKDRFVVTAVVTIQVVRVLGV